MIYLKSTNINRVRLDLGGEDLGERVERLERLIRQVIRAVSADLSDISMENLSEYGKRQIDERIKEIIAEQATVDN